MKVVLIEIDNTINLYDDSGGCIEADFYSVDEAIEFAENNNMKVFNNLKELRASQDKSEDE